MAVATGINGQLGYAEETTYGQAVTPARFAEFISEEFTVEIERMETKGIRAGTNIVRSDRWASGIKTVSGSTEFEVHNKSFGLLFKHLLGSVSSTNSGSVYTHTFTPAVNSLWGKSLTFEVGFKDTADSGFKKTITGAKAKSWELSAKINEFLMLKVDWLAQNLTTASGVTTASYPTTTTPFTFVNGSLTIGGSAVDVDEVSITGENALDDGRHFLGSQLLQQPPENGYREISGEANAEWSAWTAHDRFINGTEAALVMLFRGATISGGDYFDLQITSNVRFDGTTPTVGSLDRIMEPLSFKCVDTGSGPSTALSLVYKTTDTTP